MRAYWFKIMLGALVIFAVGLTGVSIARRIKGRVESNADIHVPLRFVPFRLDGVRVGTFRRLVIHRQRPNMVSSVNLAVQNDGQWRRLCEIVLRRPELADDPRFAGNELRLVNRDELEPLIEASLAEDTRASVEARLVEADVPFGSVNELRDVLEHPQLAARQRWFAIPSPVGELRAFHHPLNISGLSRPAGGVPALGEHTTEVLAELGLSLES